MYKLVIRLKSLKMPLCFWAQQTFALVTLEKRRRSWRRSKRESGSIWMEACDRKIALVLFFAPSSLLYCTSSTLLSSSFSCPFFLSPFPTFFDASFLRSSNLLPRPLSRAVDSSVRPFSAPFLYVYWLSASFQPVKQNGLHQYWLQREAKSSSNLSIESQTS